MHWSGKLFGVLIVITALVNTFLTAKLITVRNSWARKTQDFAKKYEENSAKLQEVRRQVDQLRDELESSTREWGAGWNGINTAVSGPDGRLTVDIGTNQRVKERQILHGFEMQQDGSVIYRGAFVVATAQADRSALNPTWRVRCATGRSFHLGAAGAVALADDDPLRLRQALDRSGPGLHDDGRNTERPPRHAGHRGEGHPR
jgi:hypothetical protein